MQDHNQKLLDFIRSKGGLEMRLQDGISDRKVIKLTHVCEFLDARGKVHLCPVFPGVNTMLNALIERDGDVYLIVTKPVGGSLDMRPRGEHDRTFEEARDQYNKECEMSGSPTRVLDIYEI